MLIDLHGIAIACESPDAIIQERWAQSFASRPAAVGRQAEVLFQLKLAPAVPGRPSAPSVFNQADLLSIHQPTSQQIIIHFPRFGQLHINLEASHVEGALVAAALNTYGVFEDVIAMGLTALLRRRHLFLIHAFAAALPSPAPQGRASGGLLLVGDIGSGKTTTGISLLRAGWKLLSNDSPLLADSRWPMADGVIAFAYPGLLSAYADTLRRFPELAPLTPAPVHPFTPSASNNTRSKITFAAESIYPDVWIASARVGAIVFPRVAHLAEHKLTRLSAPEALRRLLPNAIDRWDTAMIPEQLRLLKSLVAQAPAYQLELGEHVETLPRLLQTLLND